jgi:hypothetical protein
MIKFVKNYLEYNFNYTKQKKGAKFLGNEHNEKLAINIFYFMVSLGLPLTFMIGSSVDQTNLIFYFNIIGISLLLGICLFLPFYLKRIPIDKTKSSFGISRFTYMLITNIGLILLFLEVLYFIYLIKFQ